MYISSVNRTPTHDFFLLSIQFWSACKFVNIRNDIIESSDGRCNLFILKLEWRNWEEECTRNEERDSAILDGAHCTQRNTASRLRLSVWMNWNYETKHKWKPSQSSNCILDNCGESLVLSKIDVILGKILSPDSE